jgi:hypothetical protein
MAVQADLRRVVLIVHEPAHVAFFPARPRRLARDLAALLGGQFLRPSFAVETRKLGSVPGK